MVVLSVFLGLFSLRQMSQLQGQTSTVVDNNLPSVMILSEYRRNLDLMRRVEALLLLETPAKEQGEYRDSFDKTVAKFEELNRTYVEPTLIGSPGEAALAAVFKKDLAAYMAAASRIRASAQDPGQHAELLNHMLNTTRGLYFATSEQLDKVIQYNVDQARDASTLAMKILARPQLAGRDDGGCRRRRRAAGRGLVRSHRPPPEPAPIDAAQPGGRGQPGRRAAR